ncbi:MAG: hypothetical protein ACYCW7_15750 [Pseudomonadaceae bacterium]
MTDHTVSISVRIPARTKQALDDAARTMRMQTGEPVAVSDIIRQALDGLNQQVRAEDLVLFTITTLESLASLASSKGIAADQLADAFLAEFKAADEATCARFERAIPIMDAIGRIAAEADIEGGEQ